MAHEGQLTIVVSAVPEDTSALADRLGRYLPTDVEPVSLDIDEGLKGRAARRARAEREAERARIAARDEERARQRWGVTLGGVDLSEVRLTDVREPDPGQRHRQPAVRRHPPGRRRPARPADRHQAEDGPARRQRRGRLRRPARRAGRASSTSVVVACPAASGSGSCWPARSRPSPGARAGRADVRRRRPHRGADRRAGGRRTRGRTTVVTTVSPLWLHHADRVVLRAGRPGHRRGHPRGPAARQPRLPPRGHPRDGLRRPAGRVPTPTTEPCATSHPTAWEVDDRV